MSGTAWTETFSTFSINKNCFLDFSVIFLASFITSLQILPLWAALWSVKLILTPQGWRQPAWTAEMYEHMTPVLFSLLRGLTVWKILSEFVPVHDAWWWSCLLSVCLCRTAWDPGIQLGSEKEEFGVLQVQTDPDFKPPQPWTSLTSRARTHLTGTRTSPLGFLASGHQTQRLSVSSATAVSPFGLDLRLLYIIQVTRPDWEKKEAFRTRKLYQTTKSTKTQTADYCVWGSILENLNQRLLLLKHLQKVQTSSAALWKNSVFVWMCVLILRFRPISM